MLTQLQDSGKRTDTKLLQELYFRSILLKIRYHYDYDYEQCNITVELWFKKSFQLQNSISI